MVVRKGRKTRKYIRFDERLDVVASFELLALLAPRVKKSPVHWKWLIVAAQSAIQGALVCALSGTAGTGALQKALQADWLNWFDNRQGQPPKERLASFGELLKWVCDADRMLDSGGKSIELTAIQKRDLNKLHDNLRNEFSHFSPKGWCIEAAGLPRIIATAVDIAEGLMLQQPQIRMHLSGNQVRSIERNAAIVRVAVS